MKAIALLLLLVGLGGVAQTPKKFLADHYPLLDSIASSDLIKDDYKTLNEYAFKVTETGWMTSEADIRATFQMRDDVIAPRLSEVLTNMNEDAFRDVAWNLDSELRLIGMTIITVEGFFATLGRAAILEDEMLELATPEYHAYVTIMVKWDETQGGEYPYLDVAAEADIVALAEDFLERYPGSAFEGYVLDCLKSSLDVLTNIHLVTSEDYEYWCYSGVEIEEWPYAIETESAYEFIGEHPDSRFAPVLDSILAHPSTMEVDAETVFFVVTDWVSLFEDVREKQWTYLSSGMDIPHYIEVERLDGVTDYAVGYRFFSDYNAALDAQERLAAMGLKGDIIALTDLHNWGEPVREVR